MRTTWRLTWSLLLWGFSAFGQEEAEDAGYRYQEETVVFQALEETLSQPEFARLRSKTEPPPEESSSIPEWMERLVDWIAGFLGSRAEEDSTSNRFFILPGLELLLYAMAAIIVAVVVLFIAKAVLASSRDRRVRREEEEARIVRAGAAPGESPPEEYWRRALEYGERRRYKEALRELLLGAMSAVERRGAIRFRRGLTNRDYYYAARGGARESFEVIASRFEHVYFGRREATPDSFRECCREYQKSFREVPA